MRSKERGQQVRKLRRVRIWLGGSLETVKQTTERAKPCFDRLSTNGKSFTSSAPAPFALSPSTGSGQAYRRVDRREAGPYRVISEEPLHSLFGKRRRA